jgi:putative salt-induced outer membrane protein YdiY
MRSITALTIVSLIAFACTAYGDEVILKNGDRVTGKLEGLTDGKLTIQSDLAGKVTVETANVRTLATDEPVELHFHDGTVVKQKLLAAADGQFAIQKGEVLQPQTFGIADLAAINPPEKPRAKWSGSVTASATVTRGNSDTDKISLSMDMVRRAEKDRITFGGLYTYGRQEDALTGEMVATEDSWSALLKYDYFFSKKTYGYMNTRAARDRIAELDLRLMAGGGAGYQWVESDSFNVSTEAGLAWLYEKYENVSDSAREVSARLAYHVDRKLNEKLGFFHDLEWYPALEDLGDYFLTTRAELRASLTKSMFASFKVVLDHDSTPAPGTHKTDVKYLLGVGLTF